MIINYCFIILRSYSNIESSPSKDINSWNMSTSPYWRSVLVDYESVSVQCTEGAAYGIKSTTTVC